MIDYIMETYNIKVHTAYISRIKRSLGCEMEQAYNSVEVRKRELPNIPEAKIKIITETLFHFGVVSPDLVPQNSDVGDVTYKMIEEYVKNYNIIARSRNIAEVKRMYDLQMINSRTVEGSEENKRPNSKELVHVIEMALVYFKILDEGQVTEM